MNNMGIGTNEPRSPLRRPTMTGRLAGVDYGEKRIGLSVSDPAGRIASPYKTLVEGGGHRRQVRAVIDALAEFDIDGWVVGDPLNMNGSAGPQARMARRFAELLAEATASPVHLWDERLSSHQADVHLAGADLTHRKKRRRRDAVAAQVILQSYLDSRTAGRA